MPVHPTRSAARTSSLHLTYEGKADALQTAHPLTAVPLRTAREDFYRRFDEGAKTVVYCKASLITAKPFKVWRGNEEMPVKAVQESE